MSAPESGKGKRPDVIVRLTEPQAYWVSIALANALAACEKWKGERSCAVALRKLRWAMERGRPDVVGERP